MSTLQLPGSLVSVAWLQQHLEHDDLLIFDASWHMPATARDGLAEWQQERISGARYFDFDGRICDRESSLPHMLPDTDSFTRELRALGLNQESTMMVGFSTNVAICYLLFFFPIHKRHSIPYMVFHPCQSDQANPYQSLASIAGVIPHASSKS